MLQMGMITQLLERGDKNEYGDYIWIVEHKTGRLIFKYNRFKEVDKEAFKEYEGLLEEVETSK